MRTVEVNADPVQKVAHRAVQHHARRGSPGSSSTSPRKAPYQIVDRADGVQIVFGEGTRLPAPCRARGHALARAGGSRAAVMPAPGARAGAAHAHAARAPDRHHELRAPGGPGDRARHGRQEVHGRADQPRLQGRRPPGHLPPLRRHQRPQRGREPRGQRQGHPEAQRGSLGPGPRPHPEDQRPRLHPGGQRHPHRPARPTSRRKSRTSGSCRREGPRRRPARWSASGSPTRRRPTSSPRSRRSPSRRAAPSPSTSAPTP